MRKPWMRLVLFAILIVAMIAPAEAQRRGGGGRRGNKAPQPTPAAVDAPVEAPPGEAPPAARPPAAKDGALIAMEPHLLAYAIGPARDALGRFSDPQSAGALIGEGRVLTLEQQYSAAVAKFDQAAGAAPDDPAPMVYKGEALLYARQDAAARQALSAGKARAQARVDGNGNDAESWLLLGMAQRHLGELDAAYSSLERARAAGGDERVLYEMGATRYVQQRWQPAIDLLTQAIGANPRVAYAYYLRGIAASQSNRKDLTVNDLGRFLELAPGAPEADRARKVLASLQG